MSKLNETIPQFRIPPAIIDQLDPELPPTANVPDVVEEAIIYQAIFSLRSLGIAEPILLSQFESNYALEGDSSV